MNFVILSNSSESILNFRKELILEIQEKGFDIYVIAPNISSSHILLRFLETHKINFFELAISRSSTNLISEALYFFKLIFLLAKIKPQGILTYTIKPNLYGMIAAFILRIHGKFAMVTGLGYLFRSHLKGPAVKILQFLYGAALRRADTVFFQNTDDLNTLIDLNIISEKTNALCINGSGVNIDFFDSEEFPNTENIIFLMIGRLLISKGINEYVQASIKINKLYPDIQFNLLGWIDDNPDCISAIDYELIKECDHLTLISKLNDVRPIIKNSHVFVLPSYHEGLPRSVIEAMAMGRPIITTDAPGCRDTVINSFNGYLVQKKSVHELANAMMTFIKNPDSIFEMGKNSRSLAADKFDVKKVNKKMISEMEIFLHK